LNNLLLNELKKNISQDYIVLKNKRDSVINIILKDYDLEDIDISKLSKEINGFEISKLSTYLNNEKSRIKFLKGTL